MQVEFYGATGEVTGSCHIVECRGRRVLVDCGLIQGGGDERRRNRAPFPFRAEQIDAVVLTHAHIDHSGRLPLLVKRGFRGTIHTQRASKALTEILLRDSARLQEYDAERMSRKRGAQGKAQVKPLYGVDDAEAAIKRLRGISYHDWFEVIPGVRCRFWDAGHILGSTCVEMELEEDGNSCRLLFSGDLGQYDTPILRDPEVLQSRVDGIIMETTYGDRMHRERKATLEEFAEILHLAAEQGGNVLIPAFAVGRSQEILYHLANHYEEWGVGRFRIFLDSPLAIEASKIYWNFPQLYDSEAHQLRLDAMPALENLSMTQSPDESRAINEVKSGAIIIAGSGMCTGGRILHHMRHRLGHPNTHLIFTGYQARGTLGRRLIEGQQKIRLFGEEIQPQAQIHTLGGFSAHGDQADLLRWLGAFEQPQRLYLVHGEVEAAEAFQAEVRAQKAWDVRRAVNGEVWSLLD